MVICSVWQDKHTEATAKTLSTQTHKKHTLYETAKQQLERHTDRVQVPGRMIDEGLRLVFGEIVGFELFDG